MIEHLSSRYTVVAHIGAGAMGELFRARDTRLERDVAIKMLRPELARDPERRQRLRREARLLAGLEHPNIATLYDLEERDDALFLVLEYVAGVTLAERITAGPLPLSEMMTLARQFAEGLDAAHARGIVHRDLKPANLLVTADGQLKILDFGLARSTPPVASERDPWEPSSLTQDPTAAGTLLGTVGYMSPEQARGQSVDRRADIWAFGCILYEMLTGRRAFRGDTPTDTLVAILEREPDWAALPVGTPAPVLVVLRRCLTRDPRFRLRDIGEAWVAIVGPGTSRATAAVPSVTGGSLRFGTSAWRMAGALTLLMTAGFLAWRGVDRDAVPVDRVAYELPLPGGTPLGGRVGTSLAISPDGSRLILADQRGVWQHAMDSLGFVPGPPGRAGFDPVYSPDGAWLAIRGARGMLERLSLADGSTHAVAAVPSMRGVAWGPDDSLVYAPGFNTGLWRVSARGGPARPITRLDSLRGEVTHRWPDVLPDGHGVLYTARTRFQPTFDQAEIRLLDLRTGRHTTLIAGGTCPRYVGSGHIVFARGERLLAAPFDSRAGRLRGPAAPVVEAVDVNPSTGAAQFTCSRAGTLVYTPSAPGGWANRLAWVDRQGRIEATLPLPGLFEEPDTSPDGQRVAFTLLGAQNDIAVYDVERRALRRVTFDPHEDTSPLWSPDSRHLVYCSARDGALNLFRTRLADGAEERLTRSPFDQAPTGWSPDGSLLLFTQEDPATGTDIWALELDGSRATVPFLRTPFTERAATFSPCGRWVAYESDETGISEVYVRPFPRMDRRWQVSNGGGSEPQWSPDGRELFFALDREMWVAAVVTAPGFEASPPRRLFDARLPAVPAIAPDGRRFIVSTEVPAADRVIVRTGWFGELRRLAPRSP